MDAGGLRAGFDVAREFRVGKLFDSYRPELHYMRGPGPKWHARHAGLPAPTASEQQGTPYSLWLVPAVAFALLSLAAAVALA